MSADNLVVFGPVANPNHDNDDDNGNSDMTNEGAVAGQFPTTAAGTFDDDAFSTAAAAVTYGPNTFYPTDEDQDFVGLTTTTAVGGCRAALDRRLWQQVLDLHAAAQHAQPEPLHELAILADQAEDLLGLPVPMDTTTTTTGTHGTEAAVEQQNEAAIARPQQQLENVNVNHPPLTDSVVDQMQTQTDAATQPTNTTVVEEIVVYGRKRHAEVEDERPTFASPLKKRRHHDLLLLTDTQPIPIQQQPQQQPTARQQVKDAMETRRAAQKTFTQMEAEFSRVKQGLEQARDNYQKAVQMAQATTESVLDQLLLEDTPWNRNYRLLRNYHRKHGHVNIPRRLSAKQKGSEVAKLGRWVGEQRRNYKQPLGDDDLLEQRQQRLSLEDYQILALERLGFDWDPLRSSWRKNYQLLCAFAEENGHSRVPYRPINNKPNGKDEEDDHNDDDDEQRNLGSWVKRQRYQYKLYQEGNPSSDITPERIQLLNQLNFEWKLRGSTWMEHYEALKRFYQKHGNTLAPCSMKNLNEWTNEQRQQYRVYQENPSQSNLTAEQAKLLKDIGLSEDLREGKWHRRFQELLEFKRRHGHTILPTRYPYNQQLTHWCATQRRQYKLLEQGKKSQMTEERALNLEKAGFQWELTTQQRADAKLVKTWEELYAECEQHQEQFGSLGGVPISSSLHAWIQEQTQNYRNYKAGQPSRLTSDQKNLLDQLDYSWDKRDGQGFNSEEPSTGWEELYADLLVYRLNHGSFSISPSSEKHKALYNFVKEQRREYVKFRDGFPSLLNSERVRKLQEVQFPWKLPGGKKSNKTLPTWEELFGELVAYRLRYQSFGVPKQHNAELWRWIREQRDLYRDYCNSQTSGTTKTKNVDDGSGKMDTLEKRIEKLEEINFPWI